MALRMIADKATGFVAKLYQRNLAASLQQTGEYAFLCLFLFRFSLFSRCAQWI
jgi:hypothetical protein